MNCRIVPVIEQSKSKHSVNTGSNRTRSKRVSKTLMRRLATVKQEPTVWPSVSNVNVP
jgi:hypothetical protein